MDRRDFLKLPLGGLVLCGLSRPGRLWAEDGDVRFTREAAWTKVLPDAVIECQLCPRHCRVSDGETGWCGVRSNQQGKYQTHVFGRVVSLANDPIEKKPLFHFRPGSQVLSLATAGCNFECLFCQNWEISQFRPEQVPARWGYLDPDDLIGLAQKNGSRSIAFTYSEPVIFFEYALATARASKARGIPSVMISNGYIEPGPLDELLEVLGAIKIDFKAFDEDFYKRYCRGTLAPVLKTMKRVREKKVWLEVVHLTLPTLNDQPQKIKDLCAWTLDNLGPDVPVHFTRFHPIYKMKNLPPTPPATLERIYEYALKAGLHFPYIGNLAGHPGESTRCHHCGKVVLRRTGFVLSENHIEAGACGYCGKVIPGVWS